MALFGTGGALSEEGLLDSEFGLDFDKHLGILAVGRPGTDSGRDLPGSLKESLLDIVVAVDPDSTLEAGCHLGIEHWTDAVGLDSQMSVVVASSHCPLRLVDELPALHRNRNNHGDGDGVT